MKILVHEPCGDIPLDRHNICPFCSQRPHGCTVALIRSEGPVRHRKRRRYREKLRSVPEDLPSDLESGGIPFTSLFKTSLPACSDDTQSRIDAPLHWPVKSLTHGSNACGHLKYFSADDIHL